MAVRRRSNGVVCFVMNEMLATPLAVRGGARVAFKSRKMAFGGRILHPNRGTQSVFVLKSRTEWMHSRVDSPVRRCSLRGVLVALLRD
jgi:hypothetical protein